jgi:aminoglycoside phosphotransferase (APT) family kinase protein
MSQGQEYTRRLGMIRPDQFHAALNRFDLGSFVTATPISFGLFGQNVFVTSTHGEWVLRGCPHYDWQFPTEQFFVGLIHERTRVPVPYPYLVDPAADIFGWSYVWMPRMPGMQLADESRVAQLNDKDRFGLARAMARTLAELHTIHADCAGTYDYQIQTIQPFAKNYREMILENIRDLLAASRSCNTNTTVADVSWVEQVIPENGEAMRQPWTISLVLRDFKEANTVAERRHGEWNISGVFDLMEAHFGDGESDLVRQVGHYLRRRAPSDADEFIREYLRMRPATPGFAERQQLYMLYDSLIIWSYFQRVEGGLPENKALSLEEWAAPFVAYWKKYPKTASDV